MDRMSVGLTFLLWWWCTVSRVRIVTEIGNEEVQEEVDVMKAGQALVLDDVATKCLKESGVTARSDADG